MCPPGLKNHFSARVKAPNGTGASHFVVVCSINVLLTSTLPLCFASRRALHVPIGTGNKHHVGSRSSHNTYFFDGCRDLPQDTDPCFVFLRDLVIPRGGSVSATSLNTKSGMFSGETYLICKSGPHPGYQIHAYGNATKPVESIGGGICNCGRRALIPYLYKS